MAVMYLHMDYEAYKALEEQMRAFAETTHKSTGGFYHKSIRLKVGSDLVVEFHGPLVGGYGHEMAARGDVEAPEMCWHTDGKKAPGEPGANRVMGDVTPEPDDRADEAPA